MPECGEGSSAAQFYWQALPEMWAYSANRIGEVAERWWISIAAMQAGFNWELGPFAMWDAAGVTRRWRRCGGWRADSGSS